MKTVLKKLCVSLLVLSLLLLLGITAQASQVTAYKNPDAKIVMDGQELRFAEGN
jgi:hypothetical protein